ncbi:hypothetical protein GS896_25585 [Rhodococcus hoagii]|nr:hypothetical protein [Prescottella equi]MBM4654122.1 hypothetical protein [Prescottella equi]MBM4717745.1 hypothetical protein [Prescottella equi]MBM4719597.1 hypothetical protein [Prescottella equi]NKR23395.1 hypothetical protein [Prescottella equi]
MADNWPIPSDLSPLGKQAADTIHQFLVEKGLTDHGGGGAFHSPSEWADRGEEYGTNSLLVIVHDGGDHAAAFNSDYQAEDLQEELRTRLRAVNTYVEQCTSWYSAIYAK